MKEEVREYYADLNQSYSSKIRQLVPRYDEMVELIVDLLRLGEPRRVLDIGAGIGNVSAAVLEALPGARITAVEPCDEMFAEAARRLCAFPGRAELVNQDILDFTPAHRFDAVISNLVLHNIGPIEKRRLLTDLVGWLEPGGCFVWSDLIRHPDDRLQTHFIEYRRRLATEAGCPDEVFEKDSSKEAQLDHPLTVEEALDLAHRAGFGRVSLVWAHDMFAILLLAL
ncbi:MAG: class I SAM-dependent methyltransferase [Gemmatimonadales bacterium]|jgi:tRNA (cmo5U34)-methyltransferase